MAAAKARKGAHDDPNNRTIARNRRARHDYDILDTYECGLSLLGSEIKSLREGNVQLADTYARPERGELWLLGLHIAPYSHAAGFGGHQPERARKLLLHRKEIDRIIARSCSGSRNGWKYAPAQPLRTTFSARARSAICQPLAARPL